MGLDEILKTLLYTSVQGEYHADIAEARAKIEADYIPRARVMEMLKDENEMVQVEGQTEPAQDYEASVRNQLRAELRAAIQQEAEV